MLRTDSSEIRILSTFIIESMKSRGDLKMVAFEAKMAQEVLRRQWAKLWIIVRLSSPGTTEELVKDEEDASPMAREL